MEQVSREYELLYIISASFTDDEMAAIEGRVKALLEKYEATVNNTVRLGKFRFAYPIKHVRHGHYVMVRFTADSQAMAKIDEALRITTDVLRHLIVRADEVGSEKFDLVQFTEISADARLEARDERQRRNRDSQTDDKAKADIKSGVAALEGEKAEEPAVAVKEMSAEELEKKIDTALEDNA